MKTDNVYQTLEISDKVISNSEVYEVLSFILHLDLIVVYACRISDNTYHWLRPRGLYKIID